MAETATGFNRVLLARGVNPARTKLYRHTPHPVYRDIAQVRWREGRDRFLSFVTVQQQSAHVFSTGVDWCAHFLAEADPDLGLTARFLGVTRVLGPTVPFDDVAPVAGYIPGEAAPERSKDRVATPLEWEDGADWGDLSERLVILWGKGARAKAQWAATHPKAVVVEVPADSSGLPDLEPPPVADPAPVFEWRVWQAHLRAERRGVATRLAKDLHPLVCRGCGLDGGAVFGATLARRCMEAHHLTPVSTMPVAGRMVDPLADFAILCATCHRLIHGIERPDDLEALRGLWPQDGG